VQVTVGKNSNIAWTNHTLNGWIGCCPVSPACAHCYAARDPKWKQPAFGVEWKPDGHRHLTAESTWKQPLLWDRKAAEAGVRAKVFVQDLGDLFEDRRELDQPRARLWDLIAATPSLDWQALTKRPKSIVSMVPPPWLESWPANLWLGVTVENQTFAEQRIPFLLEIPAPVRFLSIEPMLGPIDLTAWLNRLQWVIAGGESRGRGERPSDVRAFDPEWARALRDQCVGAGVAFFLKQWGANVPAGCSSRTIQVLGKPADVPVLDRKQWTEFPAAPEQVVPAPTPPADPPVPPTEAAATLAVVVPEAEQVLAPVPTLPADPLAATEEATTTLARGVPEAAQVPVPVPTLAEDEEAETYDGVCDRMRQVEAEHEAYDTKSFFALVDYCAKAKALYEQRTGTGWGKRPRDAAGTQIPSFVEDLRIQLGHGSDTQIRVWLACAAIPGELRAHMPEAMVRHTRLLRHVARLAQSADDYAAVVKAFEDGGYRLAFETSTELVRSAPSDDDGDAGGKATSSDSAVTPGGSDVGSDDAPRRAAQVKRRSKTTGADVQLATGERHDVLLEGVRLTLEVDPMMVRRTEVESLLRGSDDLELRVPGVITLHVLLDVFLAKVPRPEMIVGVEVAFALELAHPVTGEVLPVPLVGAIDAIVLDRGKGAIWELKTAKKKWSADQLEFDLQLTAYGIAARRQGYDGADLMLLVTTKTSKPDAQVERIVRCRRDEEELAVIAYGMIEAAAAGIDYPSRGWQCRTCAYAGACR
jgi:protein gp37